MAVKHLRTLEEFLDLPEVSEAQGWDELVRGEAVEAVPAGLGHNEIVTMILSLLVAFVRPQRLGLVVNDGMGYVLSQNPDTMRIPDVSFVRRDRVPADRSSVKLFFIPPDLAVEVVSPGDRPREMDDKVQQYLAAGVRLVWIVWPKPRSVVVHTPDNDPQRLTEQDILTGGSVLPGFSVSVAELFDTNL